MPATVLTGERSSKKFFKNCSLQEQTSQSRCQHGSNSGKLYASAEQASTYTGPHWWCKVLKVIYTESHLFTSPRNLVCFLLELLYMANDCGKLGHNHEFKAVTPNPQRTQSRLFLASSLPCTKHQRCPSSLPKLLICLTDLFSDKFLMSFQALHGSLTQYGFLVLLSSPPMLPRASWFFLLAKAFVVV